MKFLVIFLLFYMQFKAFKTIANILICTFFMYPGPLGGVERIQKSTHVLCAPKILKKWQEGEVSRRKFVFRSSPKLTFPSFFTEDVSSFPDSPRPTVESLSLRVHTRSL